MCFAESQDSTLGLKGILVSPYIGAKVFLNSISTVFNFPPTKVSVFKAIKDENNAIHVEEIKTKGMNSQ